MAFLQSEFHVKSEWQSWQHFPNLCVLLVLVVEEEKEECVPINIEVYENEDIVPLDDMMEKTIEKNMEDDSLRENVEKVLWKIEKIDRSWRFTMIAMLWMSFQNSKYLL